MICKYHEENKECVDQPLLQVYVCIPMVRMMHMALFWDKLVIRLDALILNIITQV